MKHLYITLLFSLLPLPILSQSLEKGDNLLTPHVGLLKEAGDPGSPDFPMLLLTYEHMISDDFSVGLFGGYESATVESPFTEDIKRERYLVAGVINYHVINSDGFNGYLGGKLGYEDSNNEVSKGELLYDFCGGIRVFLGNSVALFGEAGLGYSNVRAGVSFKF